MKELPSPYGELSSDLQGLGRQLFADASYILNRPENFALVNALERLSHEWPPQDAFQQAVEISELSFLYVVGSPMIVLGIIPQYRIEDPRYFHEGDTSYHVAVSQYSSLFRDDYIRISLSPIYPELDVSENGNTRFVVTSDTERFARAAGITNVKKKTRELTISPDVLNKYISAVRIVSENIN